MKGAQYYLSKLSLTNGYGSWPTKMTNSTPLVRLWGDVFSFQGTTASFYFVTVSSLGASLVSASALTHHCPLYYFCHMWDGASNLAEGVVSSDLKVRFRNSVFYSFLCRRLTFFDDFPLSEFLHGALIGPNVQCKFGCFRIPIIAELFSQLNLWCFSVNQLYVLVYSYTIWLILFEVVGGNVYHCHSTVHFHGSFCGASFFLTTSTHHNSNGAFLKRSRNSPRALLAVRPAALKQWACEYRSWLPIYAENI